MFFRQQVRLLSLAQHLGEELPREIATQEPVPILGEGRVIPDRIVH